MFSRKFYGNELSIRCYFWRKYSSLVGYFWATSY